MKTEGTDLLLLIMSAFWIPLGGRYRQVSLYLPDIDCTRCHRMEFIAYNFGFDTLNSAMAFLCDDTYQLHIDIVICVRLSFLLCHNTTCKCHNYGGGGGGGVYDFRHTRL